MHLGLKHLLPVTETSANEVSRKRPSTANRAMEARSRKGSNLNASHRTLRTRKITRQFQETSRSGALKANSGNMFASRCISRMAANTEDCKSVPGNFLQRSVEEKFQGNGSNPNAPHSSLRPREITRKFQELPAAGP